MSGEPYAKVRRATLDDVAPLVAFNRAIAGETEDKELDPERLERGLRRVLADEARGLYFVAERDGAVVGCTMVTTEWSDWRDGFFWWIQSVYVAEAHRGKGVFKALYRHVENEARRRDDVCGVRLYVMRTNERARDVYRRLGMRETPYELYEVDFVLGERPH